MIIACPICKKKFKIDPILIPIKGRDLKCGSCDHVWFHKIEEKKSEYLHLHEDVISNEDKDNEKIIKKQILTKKTKKENDSSKFFSYLIVSIISFVALIVLIDTLKTPLINVFPGLEIILFSLFETLHDIKLFIIDLY